MKKLICLALVLVLTVGVFAACQPEIADNTEFYSAITEKCKLTKEFAGKSFLTEGIGEATLDALTDGDTTRFKLIVDDQTIVVRYHSVDTPESTGDVQKWGKAATLFVKERLKHTSKIVLQATAERAEHDSYGTRYLGYVWYKNEGDTDYKLLNLELVENGFSENTGVYTSKFPYYEYFDEATKFAQKIQLRIYSKLEDPLYSDDPVEVTLKEFWNNTDAYYNSDLEAGSKISFTACLLSLEVSPSGKHTFRAMYIDPESGEKYYMDVYAAYISSAASKMPIGHLYRVVGTVQVHSNGFQVSGILYDTIYGATQPGYTHPIQKDYYLTFDSRTEYGSNTKDCFYSNATVVSSSVENGVLTIVATANQIVKKGNRNDADNDGFHDTAETFTFKVTVGEGYNNPFVAGTKFRASGFQLEANSGVLDVPAITYITKL